MRRIKELMLEEGPVGVLCWIWLASFTATSCVLLWAIFGNPKWYLFVIALLATMSSELGCHICRRGWKNSFRGSGLREKARDATLGREDAGRTQLPASGSSGDSRA